MIYSCLRQFFLLQTFRQTSPNPAISMYWLYITYVQAFFLFPVWRTRDIFIFGINCCMSIKWHMSLALSVLEIGLTVSFNSAFSAFNRALQSILTPLYNYLSESVQYIPTYCARKAFLSLYHLSKIDGNLVGQKAVISPFCNIWNIL